MGKVVSGMGRETTLRQLVYMCNKEILKNEGMTRSELHDITNWVLNNAAIYDFTTDVVSITQGNSLGVGEENKDRPVKIPRFMIYELGSINAFDFINNRKDKKHFNLQSLKTFENLEDYLRHHRTGDIVVIIDGEIVDFERVTTSAWYTEIVWDIDTHIVTYELEDKEEKEVLRSKKQLENRILELVEKFAVEIQAYDLVQGERLDFQVSDIVYRTIDDNKDKLGIMWVRDVDSDFEEDDDWGGF